MFDVLAPIAFTLFAWWFGTGAILYLDGLPRRTFPWTMAGATLLAALAFWGIARTSEATTPASAYCGFACAILVWSWQEVAFLLGYVTGPRRAPCPAGARGWQRVRLALGTIAHHEAALLVLGASLAALSWNATNRTALFTYLVLYAMRQAAKLNVFLGVRNLAEEFLPPHLSYLESYFRRRAANAFWPVGVAAALAATWPLVSSAQAAAAGSHAFVSSMLLLSLLGLGILEHVFLVTPLPATGLWRWGLRSHDRPAVAAAVPIAPGKR